MREGLAEGYKVLSHVPDPGLEDLGPPLVVLGILCCHTCWLGDFGALGLPGASDEGIVVGRWHSRLLSRTAWHPGPCWSRGSGWGGRDGEARQGVRGLHALQTGRCSSGAGIEERQRGWAPLSRGKGGCRKPWFCSLNPHMPHPTRVQFSLVHHLLNHTKGPAAYACPAPDPTRVPRRLPHDLLHATRAPAPTSTRPRKAHGTE